MLKLILWIQEGASPINLELVFKIRVEHHFHVPRLCSCYIKKGVCLYTCVGSRVMCDRLGQMPKQTIGNVKNGFILSTPSCNGESVAQSCPTLCDSMDYSPQAPLSMEFSRQNTGVCCYSLFRGSS